jgi:Tfp pilus assembly protein PilX
MKLHTKQKHARGFALFSALMFLIVLIVLAVVVLKTSTNNERMAGGDLDRTIAYQLAEATLRDAEQDIMGLNSSGGACDPAKCRPPEDRFNNDSGLTGASYLGKCEKGFCYFGLDSGGKTYNDSGFKLPWEENPPENYAKFGEKTGADWDDLQKKTGAANEPIYWVEVFLTGPNRETVYYRITARAVGKNPNSVVMLQTIYSPF